jgi:membrane-bound lytic murein transglycosylase
MQNTTAVEVVEQVKEDESKKLKRKREKRLTEGFERERKKRKIDPSDGWFIHLQNVYKESDVDVIFKEIENALNTHNEEDDTHKMATLYEGYRIRIHPSDEEEAEAKAKYREWYRNLPTVTLERELKYNDEEYIKKRKEYSQKPEVIERKNQRNKARKEIWSKLKKEKSPILAEFDVLKRKPIKMNP